MKSDGIGCEGDIHLNKRDWTARLLELHGGGDAGFDPYAEDAAEQVPVLDSLGGVGPGAGLAGFFLRCQADLQAAVDAGCLAVVPLLSPEEQQRHDDEEALRGELRGVEGLSALQRRALASGAAAASVDSALDGASPREVNELPLTLR
jgi:hypothetical protein